MKSKTNFWKGLKLFTLAVTAAVISSSLSKITSVQARELSGQTIEERLENLSKELKNRSPKNTSDYSLQADSVPEKTRSFISQFSNYPFTNFRNYSPFRNYYPFSNFRNLYPFRNYYRNSNSFVEVVLELIKNKETINPSQQN